MKNLLYVFIVLLMSISCFAQEKTKMTTYQDGLEYLVATTRYDRQTNLSTRNTIHRFADGTIGVVLTGGIQDEDYPDRGTFYNYWNGNNWIKDFNNITRVEDVRSGWASYGPYGDNGEAFVSHNADNVVLWVRDIKGVGDWYKKSIVPVSEENAWPAYCFSEQGSVNVLSCKRNYPEHISSIYYSQSKTDLGETWDIEGTQVIQLGPDFYNTEAFMSDSYVWAEPRNGILAYVAVGAAADLVVMKSLDNGETWEKIVVWEHPLPFTNPGAPMHEDTCFDAEAASIAIDNNGMIHMAFTVHPNFQNASIFEPMFFQGHLFYWNESMPTFTGSDNQYRILDPEFHPEYKENGVLILQDGFDFDGDGNYLSTGYAPINRYYGSVGYPSITCAGPNRIIIAFNTFDERRTVLVNKKGNQKSQDNVILNQIFMCSYKYDENTNSWSFDKDWVSPEDGNMVTLNPDKDYSGFYNVTKSSEYEMQDCIYPHVLCQYGNDAGNMYVFFSYDSLPGLLDNNNFYQNVATDNKLVMWVNSKDFSGAYIPELKINDSDITTNKLFVFPNPTDNGKVSVVVSKNTEAILYNITGQVVGKYHLLRGNNNIDVQGLTPGMYVIHADGQTEKIMIR